jgi:hypothetical protein
MEYLAGSMSLWCAGWYDSLQAEALPGLDDARFECEQAQAETYVDHVSHFYISVPPLNMHVAKPDQHVVSPPTGIRIAKCVRTN